MTRKQRDALMLAETEKERQRIRDGIKEHGDGYEPGDANHEEWWPNKYPDM